VHHCLGLIMGVRVMVSRSVSRGQIVTLHGWSTGGEAGFCQFVNCLCGFSFGSI
jgi:hypothetical protein